jgi:hypothetical protein
MERMNIPWMNGTNEYSLNEWNEWIFHEWIFREWIFLVLGGPCQVQTQNVLRLFIMSALNFFPILRLTLFLSLWTLHAAAGNSKFCWWWRKPVEKIYRSWYETFLNFLHNLGRKDFFLVVGFRDGCLPVHSLTLCLQLHWLCREAAAPALSSSCIFLIALSFSTSSSSPNKLLQFVSRCTTAL